MSIQNIDYKLLYEQTLSENSLIKKELEALKGKGDKLNDRDKAQISLLEAEISRREKVIEVSKKQFEEQLKYYEARNLLLDRKNKFSNDLNVFIFSHLFDFPITSENIFFFNS